MLKLVLIAVFTAELSVACAPVATVHVWQRGEGPLPGKLDRVLRDYEQAWIAKDADRLASLFTEDGYVLSNGKPAVQGRAAIREAYANAGGPLWLRALAARTDRYCAYIIGEYGHDPAGPATGKFVLALDVFSSGWRIAADIDNSIEQKQGN